jgi:nicotinamidase-related amidase
MSMLERDRAALVVIDVQEAFRPAIESFDELVRHTDVLVRAARELGVPVIVTEQYPRGLGSTVPELGEALAGIAPLEKVVFAASRADGFDLEGRDQVLLCGIETHVCVSQTALDLLEDAVEVHIAADAVSSRTAANRHVALERLARAGATVTSTEAAVFELLGAAGTPEFKAVQGLVR